MRQILLYAHSSGVIYRKGVGVSLPYRARRNVFLATAAYLLAALLCSSHTRPANAQTGIPSLSALTLKPSIVVGPDTSTATVSLTAAAPAGGAVVRLQSSSVFATVPTTMTVAAGQTSGTFTVSASAVPVSTPAVITATYGQMYRATTLTVNKSGANPKIPQADSASFRKTGNEAPSGSLTWDITRGGSALGTNSTPNGWAVSFDATGTVLTVSVPPSAPIAANYKVRYSTGSQYHSALFDVVAMNGVLVTPGLPAWASDVAPIDSSPAGGAGPSAADSVELATGVYENIPGPDMIVRNPIGPDAVYSRFYRSSRAAEGYGSPGLTPGWVDNYDITLQSTSTSGTWAPLRLKYPNGAVEVLTPLKSAAGTPTGKFTGPSGAPYLLSGVASKASGQWQSLTILGADESRMTFTPSANNPNLYLLTRITNALGQSLAINYDASFGNRLRSITDGATRPVTLISFVYGGAGYLSEIQDIYGRRVQFSYTASGGSSNLTGVSQRYVSGSRILTLWSYGYTSVRGMPFLNYVAVPSPTGTGSLVGRPVVYDAQGRVSYLLDANGNRRQYGYNSGSTMVQVLDTTGRVAQAWTQRFNSLNAATGTMDVNSKSTSVTYADGTNTFSPTRGTNENGQAVSATYDSFGNVLQAIDSRGLTSTSSYDYSINPFGRVSSVQTGAKTPTRYSYYTNGLLMSVDSPAPGTSGSHQWVRTSYTYTSLGNIQTVTVPAPSSGGTVTYRYGYTFDPVGGYAKAEAIGEPVTITDPLGNTSHYRYDDRGNVTAVIDAEGNRADYVYNFADQLIQVVDPATGQTGTGRRKTLYNYLYVEGPLQSIQVLDESGKVVRTVSSVLGNEGEAVKAKLNAAIKETNGYDGQYRAGSFGDGKNQTTRAAYDPVGNPTSVTFPMGDKQQFTKYDAAGNLLERLNGRGTLIRYIRANDDSRVTDIKYSDSTPGVHFDHDIYGRVTRMVDGSGTTTYIYDDNDTLTSTATTYIDQDHPGSYLPTKTVSYTYNPDGSRAAMSTPVGSYTYSYDSAGRMTDVNFPWANGYGHYTYYKNGWLKSQSTYKVYTGYQYNALGQLTLLKNSATESSPAPWSKYDNFRYTALGQRTHTDITIPEVSSIDSSNYKHTAYPDYSGTIDYRYDEQGHLVRETSVRYGDTTSPWWWQIPFSYFFFANYDQVFTWDAAGNPSPDSYMYNANNQYGTHDADGNRLSGGWTYDAENRLVTDAGAVSIGYRSDGLRSWRKDTGVAPTARRYYLYDGMQVICELTADGTCAWAYGIGANGPLQRYNFVISKGYSYSFDPQGTLVQRHLHSLDHPNDVFIYSAFGSIVQWFGGEEIQIDPFLRPNLYIGSGKLTFPGDMDDSWRGSSDPVGFLGQHGIWTDDTNYCVMGYRYYGPWAKRFLTRDPIGYEGGANLYAYCDGDPVNKVDPLGLQEGRISGDYRYLREKYREAKAGNISSASEIRAAKELRARGNQVKFLKPVKGVRTADLLVNGVTTDVYTPTTNDIRNIVDKIVKKDNQAEHIFLDLSHTSVTKHEAKGLLSLVRRSGARNIKRIIVFGAKEGGHKVPFLNIAFFVLDWHDEGLTQAVKNVFHVDEIQAVLKFYAENPKAADVMLNSLH